MVLLNIKLRPQRGYTFPNTVKEISVDSSVRLEEMLASVKLDKKGTSLYRRGIEMPLNSSLASHNVRNGDIIETCSSPLLSAVLSSVISDLEAVQQVDQDQRILESIEALLDSPSLLEAEDWDASRWSFDHVKRRSICLKMLKQVVQRNGRFADLQVPSCTDLTSLYNFVKETRVFSNVNGGFSSMEQCFKPSARNRNGRPSICWELMQQKLDKLHRIMGASDPIEAFVLVEQQRHGRPGKNVSTRNTPPKKRDRTTGDASNQSTPQRRNRASTTRTSRRSRHLLASTLQKEPTLCLSCTTGPTRATCICLQLECPFAIQPSCFACFRDNHPRLIRNHEEVPLTDTRAKTILRQQSGYCPEYASGPFCILMVLYEQSTYKDQLSLTEDRLKELAQPYCRSNLYDRQARGRTAFACVEKLCSEDLIRKEIIPGGSEEAAKYSLMPKGESLAKFCFNFHSGIQSIVRNNNMESEQKKAINGGLSSNRVKIIVDNREDKTFAKRLTTKCDVSDISYYQRNLPAGDYLFITNKQEEEHVFPLVIERKTWSDMADSVAGKGRRRLDCVKVGATMACSSHCQLCRMKRSQCSRIMFIIEGARCLNRDQHRDKCSNEKRCKYCKELQDRHGREMTQSKLEEVIYRLQVEHQCLVHFTRDYNETITSLILLREILAAGVKERDLARNNALSNGLAFSMDLTYTQFCANARSSTNLEVEPLPPRGTIVEWKDEDFANNIYSGKLGESMLQQLDLKTYSSAVGKASTVSNDVVDLSSSFTAEQDEIEILDESQESIQILDEAGWSSSKTSSLPISVDDESEDDWECEPESQNSVEVLEHLGLPMKASPPRKRPRYANEESRVTRVDDLKPTLLLVSGLYEYDTEFNSDANKLWKDIFNRRDQFDFTILVKQTLCDVQDADTPLVERKTILFWILYVQLRFNIILHASREGSCAEKLKLLWKGHATAPDDQSTFMGNVALSDIGSNPPGENSCIICFEKLGKCNVEGLPCGHCFHSNCLRQWWTMKNVQLCPTCKFEVGGQKNIKVPSPQSTRTPQVGQRTALTGDRLSYAAPEIREARLRRFDAASSNIIPSSGRTSATNQSWTPYQTTGSSNSWSCSVCTYDNDIACSVCEMCGKYRVRQNGQTSASTTPTKVLAKVETNRWRCSTCTLENDLTKGICDVCGSVNPFTITERPASPPTHALHTIPKPSTSCFTSMTSSKKVKCGACGGAGHNRGNYTATTCPSYYDEAELQLRKKKKGMEERKQREAQQKIEEIERTNATGTEKIEQIQTLLSDVQRNQQAQESVAASEVKRLKQVKARAEKRAGKL